jgi:hypothetical protein
MRAVCHPSSYDGPVLGQLLESHGGIRQENRKDLALLQLRSRVVSTLCITLCTFHPELKSKRAGIILDKTLFFRKISRDDDFLAKQQLFPRS